MRRPIEFVGQQGARASSSNSNDRDVGRGTIGATPMRASHPGRGEVRSAGTEVGAGIALRQIPATTNAVLALAQARENEELRRGGSAGRLGLLGCSGSGDAHTCSASAVAAAPVFGGSF